MSAQAERDLDLLTKAWGLCADPPKVNYSKLAELAGYKTAASATTAYCNAKKRFFDRMGDGGKDSKTAAAGKKGTAKKRSVGEVEGGEKPKPKKGRGAKKAKVQAQEDGDEDDGIEKLLNGAREFIKAEEGGDEDEV